MPSEIRRLVFYYSELSEALVNQAPEYGVKFPKGKITKAKIAGGIDNEIHTQKFQTNELSKEYNLNDDPKAIIVTFFNEDTFEHKYFSLSSEFVSSALIKYCIDRSIPLPRAGKKKIDITEFNICLDIVFDMDDGSSLELELD